MSKQQILRILEENRSACVSGEELARRLGLTRAAVWKAVRALRGSGYQIESKPGGGYRLEAPTDLLLEEAIASRLTTRLLGKTLRLYDTVDSTNLELRRLAGEGAPEGLAVLAEQQTAGRGRLGRSFHSPPHNGVYLSILLRPQLPYERIHFLTMLAAVCVTEAIRAVSGLQPQIKWVNDVLLDGKKLCGILNEATVEGESGCLSAVIVGIGVNVGTARDFPVLTGNTAGALGDFAPARFTRCQLVAEILNRFEGYYLPYLASQDPEPFLASYRRALCLVGQRVAVWNGNLKFDATVEGLAATGGLLVRGEDGVLHELTSGEVSVRPAEGERPEVT